MASNEAGLWEWLRDIALPLGHYSRIESPETAPGFPDVDYTVQGRAGKIELKHSHGRTKPPFKGDDDGLHKSQRIWIRECVRNGGTVWIFAEIKDQVFIIPGSQVARINGNSLVWLEEISVAILDIKDPRGAAHILKELL